MAEVGNETQEMPEVKLGSFTLLEYTLLLSDNDELYETTSEEVAKKKGKFDESKKYGPKLVIVGSGMLHKEVESQILGLHEGESKKGKISADKAFGIRDPSKIRAYIRRRIEKRIDKALNVGDVIEIDGKIGVVESITGGRVRISFNHPLAGRGLDYEVKVVKILESTSEKAKAIVNDLFPVDILNIKLDNNTLSVTYPYHEDIALIEGAKSKIRGMISKYLKDIGEIRFTEVYKISEK